MLPFVRGLVGALAVALVGLAVAGAVWGGDDDLCWALFLMGLVCAGAWWAAGRVLDAREPWRRRPTRS